jgi:uncharacterized membrane protein YfcA
MRKISFIINAVFILVFSLFSLNGVIIEHNYDGNISEEGIALLIVAPVFSPLFWSGLIIIGAVAVLVLVITPTIILDIAAYKTKNKIVSIFFYIFFIVGGFIISCFAYLWGFLIFLALFGFRIYADQRELNPQENENAQNEVPLVLLIIGLFVSFFSGMLHYGFMVLCFAGILVLSIKRIKTHKTSGIVMTVISSFMALISLVVTLGSLFF